MAEAHGKHCLRTFCILTSWVLGEKNVTPLSVYRKQIRNMSDLLSNEHVFTDITNELFAQGLVAKKELDNITSVKSLSKNEKGSAMAHLFHDKIKDSDNPWKCVMAICKTLEDDSIEDEKAKKIARNMRNGLEVRLANDVILYSALL